MIAPLTRFQQALYRARRPLWHRYRQHERQLARGVVARRVQQPGCQLALALPGVGAQGGALESALRAGLRADAMGLLINVSRGISRAEDPEATAADLRDRIAQIRRGPSSR